MVLDDIQFVSDQPHSSPHLESERRNISYNERRIRRREEDIY
jgi:hypothetical protein